jgi:hypothetical protein
LGHEFSVYLAKALKRLAPARFDLVVDVPDFCKFLQRETDWSFGKRGAGRRIRALTPFRFSNGGCRSQQDLASRQPKKAALSHFLAHIRSEALNLSAGLKTEYLDDVLSDRAHPRWIAKSNRLHHLLQAFLPVRQAKDEGALKFVAGQNRIPAALPPLDIPRWWCPQPFDTFYPPRDQFGCPTWSRMIAETTALALERVLAAKEPAAFTSSITSRRLIKPVGTVLPSIDKVQTQQHGVIP